MDYRNKKNLYEVSIADVPLKLLSEHSDELVKEMVQIVDQKVEQALSSQKTPSLQNAALLAALNIAEEYILLKDRAAQRIDRLVHHTEEVLTQLDSPNSVTTESNI